MNEPTNPTEEIVLLSRIIARHLPPLFLEKGDWLSPSVQKALFEIGSGAKTAQELGRRLDLDKSSISRILGKLQEAGLVRVEGRSSENYRAKPLSLTTAGNNRFCAFNDLAETRIKQALQQLSPDEIQSLVATLRTYAWILTTARGRTIP